MLPAVRVGILNYGVGNIRSLTRAVERIDHEYRVVDGPADLGFCSHLILPGVGHFDECTSKFAASGLSEAVREDVFERRKPLLGICVGYQMLGRGSEEGTSAGLGWIDADVIRFPSVFEGQKLRVPHVGWSVLQARPGPLFDDFEVEPRFYFTHSYYVKPDEESRVAGRCRYGFDFAAAYSGDNIYGVQFHPEKSHDAGIELFRNFVQRTH